MKELLNFRLGTDIVYMPRLMKYVNDCRFLEKVLTDAERKQFDSFLTDNRKCEYLSGRIAAKEACMKARSAGIYTYALSDFEILNYESGAPYIEDGLVSISHDGDYAVASVILCNQ